MQSQLLRSTRLNFVMTSSGPNIDDSSRDDVTDLAVFEMLLERIKGGGALNWSKLNLPSMLSGDSELRMGVVKFEGDSHGMGSSMEFGGRTGLNCLSSSGILLMVVVVGFAGLFGALMFEPLLLVLFTVGERFFLRNHIKKWTVIAFAHGTYSAV